MLIGLKSIVDGLQIAFFGYAEYPNAYCSSELSGHNMNILFVTGGRLDAQPYGDGSTRYRCFNMAEALRSHGFRADVTTLAALDPGIVERYDIVSCLRPVTSRKLHRLVSTCLRHDVKLVADFDDLIFDPDLAVESPRVINGFARAKKVAAQFADHAKALQGFSHITASTPAIADHATNTFPNKHILLLRNGLSEYWLQHANFQRSETKASIELAYLPGTRSHDADFRSIMSTLATFLAERVAAKLHIVGKLDGAESLPAAQLQSSQWIDYFELPSIIAGKRATLAPLTDTRFNQAKSHIKFIESAALGVPAICSPNSDIELHDIDGLFKPVDAESWLADLHTVSADGYAEQQLESLRDYAYEYCTALTYTRTLAVEWNSDEFWHSYASAA